MKTLICWRLESVSLDHANGLVARFSSKEEAINAQGKAGGYGPHICEEEFKIYDTAFEFNATLNIKARKSGLEKLTDEEKLALGL